MILVDTSIWIGHLRSSDPDLSQLLSQERVLSHPFVIGELAMGNLKPRDPILNRLQQLPKAVVADHQEVLEFVTRRSLHGVGIGYMDAHLLASVRITPRASLWTRDKRLLKVAADLHLAWTKQLLH